MTRPGFVLLVQIIAAILLVNGCSLKKNDAVFFSGYDLQNPQKFFLPESLLEISGICFYKGKKDTAYAVQDEAGKLFRVPLNIKKQYNCKFWKGGDYEDLTIIRETVFILKSDGSIYSFPFSEAVYPSTDSTREWKNALPDGEYEGLYGDEAEGKLVVLCKNCPGDETGNRATGYVLDANNPEASTQKFEVTLAGQVNLEEKTSRGFRPSALSKHPVTGEWYILSAVNQLLLVADSNWHITRWTPLPESVFNHPEGIAFDSEGNMYISNEGDDMNPGKILKFTQHNRK